MKSVEDKFTTVIQKNTFYFFNQKFEENYEGYINSLKETLLIVKNKVETEGLKKEIFEWLLKEKENGLRALLALTGFSNEYLKRLTTIIRIVNDPELNSLVYKDKWYKEKNPDNIHEWSDGRILKKIQSNEYFRKGLVNLFFEGASIPFLANTIPLFELKKLSISKLNFEIPELIDTIIRYKEKGSYSGMKGNNPETVIADILEKLGLTYETGDLTELISNAPDNKRTMDFIIPNKENPLIIVESSFLATTSSGQGDKSKTEISIDALIKEHYPNATFVGFVDGIGWYVRKSDLKRMVTAYEDVFTFHKDELQRFEKLLIKTFKK
jgi:hypothetical protein